MKSSIYVVILAGLVYILLRPTTFTVENDIFIYKLPEDVYEFMSDLQKTVEQHSTDRGTCTLLKKRTRNDGVKEKLFLVKKFVPLFWDYEIPFNLETRLTFTMPKKEFQYGFAILRGYLLQLHAKLTFEPREGRVAPGCLLTEELTITCPWLARSLVEKITRDAHKDTLIRVRNGLEGLYIPKEYTEEEEEELKAMLKEQEKKAEESQDTVKAKEEVEEATGPKTKAKKEKPVESRKTKGNDEKAAESQKTKLKKEKPATSQTTKPKEGQKAAESQKTKVKKEKKKPPPIEKQKRAR